MTIRYKSDTFDLTTSNITTVLTCPSNATIIVKTVQTSHENNSNVDVDLHLQKSGGSDVEISHAQLNKNFINMISNTLNMEANDILKIKAGTANQITGVVSYALIDRSQENG
jgi:uncharacterized ubiquitin-like protein YukD